MGCRGNTCSENVLIFGKFSCPEKFFLLRPGLFLLKGLEKVVDRYLRDGPLLDLPIHPRQHAFQAGKSTESALHQLVNRIEKALSAGQYALGVFFGIQGAFDNTPLVSVNRALRDRKVSFAVQQWITALLDQRKVGVQVGSIYIRAKTQCGLP